MKNTEKLEINADVTTAKCYFMIEKLMETLLEMHVTMPDDPTETYELGKLEGYNDALTEVFYHLYNIYLDIDKYLGYKQGFEKEEVKNESSNTVSSN